MESRTSPLPTISAKLFRHGACLSGKGLVVVFGGNVKWYKHLVESGDDPDIMEAIIHFKSDGYMVFFRTLEIMAREFDVENPGISVFPVKVLRKKFPISWQKTVKILQFFHRKKRIFISFSTRCGLEHIKLNCPKLKELCDEYTQKILKENRE